MRIVISETADEVAEYASNYIISAINAFVPSREKAFFVLGLPTGGTPLATYKRIIQRHREGAVSFKHVVTFNMDEYVGLPPTHPQSYHYFMKTELFDFIDLPEGQRFIPNGNADDLLEECAEYERRIARYGGVDLFVCGLGTDGHLAFNEPGSSLNSRTRVKSLNQETRRSNARFFGNDLSKVPTMALTVGIQTVMSARRVILLATGAAKAQAVAGVVAGPITHRCTASKLQEHPLAVLVLDRQATQELSVSLVDYYEGLKNSERELEERQQAARRRREGAAQKGAAGATAKSKL